VTQSADVSVVKTGEATVTENVNTTYQVTVSNAGPSNAADVLLSDPVPPGARFVSVQQTSGPTFSCVPPPPSPGGVLNCSIALLPAGSSATFDVVLRWEGVEDETVSNTAAAAAATEDPDADDNASSAEAEFIPAVSVVEIPTLSTLGLVVFAIALAAIGLGRRRRLG
jgi:uncharacterized repeat protein (TIGR01451 family)